MSRVPTEIAFTPTVRAKPDCAPSGASDTDRGREIAALRPYLVRFARTKLRDESAAQDVVQDTLVAALSGNNPFLGRSSLRTWMTSILGFKIIDTYRSSARDNIHRMPNLADDGDEAPADEAPLSPPELEARLRAQDPGRETERRQLADRVMAAVQTLPARQRDIFVLVQVHGYSGDQAARLAGVSLNNVWVTLHRARKVLQSRLQGVYQESLA